MTLLTLAVVVLGQAQDTARPPTERHSDEAIVEAVARSYLPTEPEKTKVSFLALWPDYSKVERRNFKEEIERLLNWPPQTLSDEERANLVKVRDSISSTDWSAPKLLSISEMRLDERVLVTRIDFNRRSLQVANRRGARGTVIKHIRIDAPSYSTDGKWAVVHPHSLLYEGSANWYDGMFLQKTPAGWKVEFKVVVIGND